MSYTATIKRMSDGVTVDIPVNLDWDQRVEGFMCDCSRARMIGDQDQRCGDNRYTVRITLPDGSIPYDEIAHRTIKSTLEADMAPWELHAGKGFVILHPFTDKETVIPVEQYTAPSPDPNAPVFRVTKIDYEKKTITLESE